MQRSAKLDEVDQAGFSSAALPLYACGLVCNIFLAGLTINVSLAILACASLVKLARQLVLEAASTKQA